MSPADWTHVALSQQQANALADRTTAANKEGTWLLMYPGLGLVFMGPYLDLCFYMANWLTSW